jgi:hypothetical protein
MTELRELVAGVETVINALREEIAKRCRVIRSNTR